MYTAELLLVLCVTAADKLDQAQVAEVADRVQAETSEIVEIAWPEVESVTHFPIRREIYQAGLHKNFTTIVRPRPPSRAARPPHQAFRGPVAGVFRSRPHGLAGALPLVYCDGPAFGPGRLDLSADLRFSRH